jgi:stearoyl-CoA desaturase (delta-9 desaturase)
MMKPVMRVQGEGANAVAGKVVVDAKKAAWNLGMVGTALFLAPFTASIDAILVFIVLTYFGLLFGHSIGMHRFMIHRTFDAPLWLERLLVYIGVLVGMSGPYGVIHIHDQRDWAQRQSECHDFFAHRRGYCRDVLWQLACVFRFDAAPLVTIEPKFADDPWYRWMDRTWRYQQLLLAIPLFLAGGWSWVVWGVAVRVAVSNVGHWTITYVCHNPGPGRWFVKGASVQASDFQGLGLISCGECWHSNHHAFPESARIGLEPGQFDPSWQIIRMLEQFRLAYNVGLPRPREQQGDLAPRGHGAGDDGQIEALKARFAERDS